MTEKDRYIEKMIETLGCSRAEAEELWLFDNEEIESEERSALTEKAKENRHYEKGNTPRKKGEPKERKIDPDKQYLHTLLMKAIYEQKVNEGMPFGDITPKNEAEISFTFNGANYTIKLTKHRK